MSENHKRLIPKTCHRSVTCDISADVKSESDLFIRRFKFKKSNCDSFAQDLDQVLSIKVIPEKCDEFVDQVKSAIAFLNGQNITPEKPRSKLSK